MGDPPTDDVLRKFRAGGPGLVATWYVLTLSAVLFIPATVLVYQVLASDRPASFLRVALAFGVMAGLVQTLGFIRCRSWCRTWRRPTPCRSPAWRGAK